MITNNDVYRIWFELSDEERLQVITKFKLADQETDSFLRRNDIKNYLRGRFILTNGKVVIK
jgi:hypothetical protein